MKASCPKKSVLAFLVTPAVLIFVAFLVVPICVCLYLSFFKWSGGRSVMQFVGLENYLALFQDKRFWVDFWHNIQIMLYCMVGQIGLGFLFACLLNSRKIRRKGTFKFLIFVPQILSYVVIGFVWYMVYSYDIGLLNWLLRTLGLESWIRMWLDDPSRVILSATIPLIWKCTGLYMLIFLSGMQSIDNSIYEMAEIDGASALRRVFSITVPLLKGTFMVALMLCISGNMTIFDHIYSMTSGGPGNASEVLALYVYKLTFKQFEFGYGAAASIMIIILSLVIILGMRKLLNVKGGSENGLAEK